MKKITINQALSDWYRLREEKKKIDTEINLLKESIAGYMIEKGKQEVASDEYKVVLKTINKESISKRTMPEDIWAKYARKSSYRSLVITHLGGREIVE